MQKTEAGNLWPGHIEASHFLVNISQLCGFHIPSNLNIFEVDLSIRAQGKMVAAFAVLQPSAGGKRPGEEFKAGFLIIVHAAIKALVGIRWVANGEKKSRKRIHVVLWDLFRPPE